MKIDDLKKIIKKNTKSKNIDKIEWDSLAHLSILMDLEKEIPNKINKISNLSDATNFKKLSKLLKDKKLIKK